MRCDGGFVEGEVFTKSTWRGVKSPLGYHGYSHDANPLIIMLIVAFSAVKSSTITNFRHGFWNIDDCKPLVPPLECFKRQTWFGGVTNFCHEAPASKRTKLLVGLDTKMSHFLRVPTDLPTLKNKLQIFLASYKNI